MRVIVITGGSRGIGASTAIAAARRAPGVMLTCNGKAVAMPPEGDNIQGHR